MWAVTEEPGDPLHKAWPPLHGFYSLTLGSLFLCPSTVALPPRFCFLPVWHGRSSLSPRRPLLSFLSYCSERYQIRLPFLWSLHASQRTSRLRWGFSVAGTVGGSCQHLKLDGPGPDSGQLWPLPPLLKESPQGSTAG